MIRARRFEQQLPQQRMRRAAQFAQLQAGGEVKEIAQHKVANQRHTGRKAAVEHDAKVKRGVMGKPAERSEINHCRAKGHKDQQVAERHPQARPEERTEPLGFTQNQRP